MSHALLSIVEGTQNALKHKSFCRITYNYHLQIYFPNLAAVSGLATSTFVTDCCFM